LIPAVVAFFVLWPKFIDNSWVLGAGVTLGLFAVFVNFPKFIKALHNRPVYYSDLRGDERLQERFLLIMQIFLAFMIAVVVDYYMESFRSTRLKTFEVIGVIGGMSRVMSSMLFVNWYIRILLTGQESTAISGRFRVGNLSWYSPRELSATDGGTS